MNRVKFLLAAGMAVAAFGLVGCGDDNGVRAGNGNNQNHDPIPGAKSIAGAWNGNGSGGLAGNYGSVDVTLTFSDDVGGSGNFTAIGHAMNADSSWEDFEFYPQMQWREPSNGVIEFIGWYNDGVRGVHTSPYTIRNGFSGSDTLVISKFYIQETYPVSYGEGRFVRFLGFVDG